MGILRVLSLYEESISSPSPQDSLPKTRYLSFSFGTETEEKLRYALSVRTLIELSLIRASRIASTATIEELMKAVRQLKSSSSSVSSGEASFAPPPAAAHPRHSAPVPAPQVSPALQSTPAPTKEVAQEAVSLASRNEAILDSPQVSGILSAVPGAQVIDIRKDISRR